MGSIRILFLSDTHLGFDLPFRPRIKRTRRGPDFFNNLDIALTPAHAGNVDCVVHGGDLFYRSKVPLQLVEMAFEPLLRAAQNGIPVYLVRETMKGQSSQQVFLQVIPIYIYFKNRKPLV